MPSRPVLSLMLAIPLAALAACGDDVTDPAGFLDSAEAEAVMRSARALPMLPEFMDGIAGDHDRAAVIRARELWDAGMAADDPRGGARRRLAVRSVLPLVTASVPRHEWVAARTRMEDWMGTAASMLRHLSLPAVQARLDAAADHLDRSDAALSERDRAHHLLLATSELVETTPRYVARTLARDAESAVARAMTRGEDAVRPEALERAERLRDWSLQALESGDYFRAIQRAYYALQLVETR